MHTPQYPDGSQPTYDGGRAYIYDGLVPHFLAGATNTLVRLFTPSRYAIVYFDGHGDRWHMPGYVDASRLPGVHDAGSYWLAHAEMQYGMSVWLDHVPTEEEYVGYR